METHTLYNGQLTLVFEEEAHRYTVDGHIPSSITGVLQVVAKPALLPWVAKQTGDYLERNWKPGRSYDESEILQLIKDAKKSHREIATGAATIGTAVHKWIEQYLKGRPLPMPSSPELVNGIKGFLQFQKEHNLEVIESERRVYSIENDVAGTCDIHGLYEGSPCVVDIKTSSGIYAEAVLQTGGYDLCLSEELGIEFTRHIIINCRKNGKLDFHISENTSENREGFLAALKLYRSLETIKRALKEK